MAKPTYEKNRYLRLDGSPIEQGFIRRTLAPRGLSLCFLVSAACTVSIDKLEDVGDLIPAVVFTGAGILQRRFLNFSFNTTWQMDFHRYRVDTQPSPRTQHNPPSNYALRASFLTAITGITGVACIMNAGDKYDGNFFENLSETWEIDFSTQFPTFHLAYQQGLTYHNVKKGKWKIVKIADMEPATEPKKAPTQLSLSSTPV
jgi:hypothetical protein